MADESDKKKADESPTSVRLDSELKKKLIEAAEQARQSQADYIATAIEMRMRGTCEACGRAPADTGAASYWDKRLQSWCERLGNGADGRGAGPIVIATDEGAAGRRVYLGRLRAENVRESAIMLTDVPRKTRVHDVVIPRSAIRIWDTNLAMHELLVRLGYFPMAEPPPQRSK